MKVLILNSGMGKRMGELTSEHPKCMTIINDEGDTILSRQLKIIQKNGIREVVITTGLFDKVLIEYCNSLELELDISFVNNQIYDKTNYIYSIYKAKDKVLDDIILMHGDLVFSEEVYKMVLSHANSCMVVSGTKELPDKDFKAVIYDENSKKMISKVGIEFFDSAMSAQPLYKIDKENWIKWLEKIEEYCENGNTNCYAENAFNDLNGECKIEALDVENELCEEIDTIEDLERLYNRG